jgi:hypothetical protein
MAAAIIDQRSPSISRTINRSAFAFGIVVAVMAHPLGGQMKSGCSSSKCAEEEARPGFSSFINFDNISPKKNLELQVLKIS